MDEKRRKAILVGVAFMLPLVFIAVVLISTVIPSARLSTNFNFVYGTCNESNNNYSYNCGNYLNYLYRVENERLLIQSIPEDLDSDQDSIPLRSENYRTRLYIHDNQTNISREISLAEAQQYRLSDRVTSPDDVSVEWESSRSNGFFLFYDTSSTSGHYLTKGRARKELNLIGDNEPYYFQSNLIFIGWVIN